jgi:soluble lytic murein transglycosylase-like protein
MRMWLLVCIFAAIAALTLAQTASAMPTQDPLGTGAARWWPLAHYVGWPTSARSAFVYIVNRESQGQPHVANPSGCYGLLQIAPFWWSGKPRVRGRRWMFWPLNQLRLGLHIWRLQHGSFMPAWAL